MEGQKAYREGASPAARFVQRAAFWMPLLMLGLGIALVCFDRNTVEVGIVFTIIGSVCLFGVIFERRRFAARYLKKNPNVQKEYKIEFSEEGIEVWGAELRTKVGWSNFQRWRESETVFLVYPHSTIYNIYPKRVFKQNEIDELRDLLGRKIAPK
jgi:YcxB-like protein